MTRTIVVGCSLVFSTIALRLYVRVVYTKRLWMDDYVAILAAVGIFVLQRAYESFGVDTS
jgi:hypothetical protein